MTDRKSIPTYIAWLSTCLLSVSAGHLIGDFMEPTWLLLGAFGIVAAVGLQAASQAATTGKNETLWRAV